MAHRALENAIVYRDQTLERIRQLEHELAQAKTDLAQAEAFVSGWSRFNSVNLVDRQNESRTSVDDSAADIGPTRRPKNSKKEEIAKAVRQLVEQAGTPLGRRELLEALMQQGYKIQGGNPDMILSTMLWRAGQAAGVVRLKSGGYWLIEKPWESAGYLGASQTDSSDTPLSLDEVPE